MPILGICRGCQVLNVARGGDLIQHIGSDGTSSELHHRQRVPGERCSHRVEIEPDSGLARAVGVTDLDVNSFHHQAVRTLGRGLRATARAPDGVIEAIEDPERRLYLGVQWHAEFDTERPTGIALLRTLVDAAMTPAVAGRSRT
jgi:putative glutamine amidotransferase